VTGQKDNGDGDGIMLRTCADHDDGNGAFIAFDRKPLGSRQTPFRA